MSYDILRLDHMKPDSTTHEIQTGFNRKTQQMVARSQRFSNRILPGTSVSVRRLRLMVIFATFLTYLSRESGSRSPMSLQHFQFPVKLEGVAGDLRP